MGIYEQARQHRKESPSTGYNYAGTAAEDLEFSAGDPPAERKRAFPQIQYGANDCDKGVQTARTGGTYRTPQGMRLFRQGDEDSSIGVILCKQLSIITLQLNYSLDRRIKQFSQITEADVIKFADYLRTTQISVSTHNRKIVRLRKIFNTLQSKTIKCHKYIREQIFP